MVIVAHGNSCYRVAEWFGHDPRTVERWVRAFERQGPEGLSDQPRPGRARKLTPQQEDELRALVASAADATGEARIARWTGRLLADHVAHAMNVRISIRRGQLLLRDFRTQGALRTGSGQSRRRGRAQRPSLNNAACATAQKTPPAGQLDQRGSNL